MLSSRATARACGHCHGRAGLKEAAELDLEEGFGFPGGEGVAVDGKGGGDGGSGMASDEELGGAELVGGERTLGALGACWHWVRFAYGRLMARVGVEWRVLAGVENGWARGGDGAIVAGGFVPHGLSGWRGLARFGMVWRGLAGEGVGSEADALEYLVDGLVEARETRGGDGARCMRHGSLLFVLLADGGRRSPQMRLLKG